VSACSANVRYIDVLILVYICADGAVCADTTMLCMGRIGEVGDRMPVCFHFTCLYMYLCLLCVPVCLHLRACVYFVLCVSVCGWTGRFSSFFVISCVVCV
jgi:hypothetical protein